MNASDTLRAQTGNAHRALERSLDMLSPQFDLPRYRATVRGFYAFLRPLLTAIDAQLPPHLSRDLHPLRHIARLERDLRALAVLPGKEAGAADMPAIGNLAQALGALYVIEGSMLGARILAPHLQRAFGIDADSGCAYFRGDHGAIETADAAGVPWPQFRQLLDRLLSPEAVPAAAKTATATFTALQRWLT